MQHVGLKSQLGPGFPDRILVHPCAHMDPDSSVAFIERNSFYYLSVACGWHWTDGGGVPIKDKSHLNYTFTLKSESRDGSSADRSACCSVRGCRFRSLHPHAGSLPSVCPVPSIKFPLLMPLRAAGTREFTHVHASKHMK